MPDDILPEWEKVLFAAAHLQRILPDSVLVGGSCVALASHLGDDKTVNALRSLDSLYPQPNRESPLQQLQVQLAQPLPYDLEELNLAEYKNLAEKWRSWTEVQKTCAEIATLIFDRITGIVD